MNWAGTEKKVCSGNDSSVAANRFELLVEVRCVSLGPWVMWFMK